MSGLTDALIPTEAIQVETSVYIPVADLIRITLAVLACAFGIMVLRRLILT